MLLLQKQLSPEATFVYVPYIPVEKPYDWHTGLMIENITQSIQPYLPKNCIFVRYDIPWESPWINDENRFDDKGIWLGNPEVHVRELRMNFGTKHHALREAVSDVLPSNTFIVDLTKSDAELLENMKSKTRYNIKLAQRKGINVRIAHFEELEKWYQMYKETTLRNGIYKSDYKLFKEVINSEKVDNQTELYMMLAETEKQTVAGMFLTITNQKTNYYGNLSITI